MPLEDSSRIDITTLREDGKPCFVITDSGLTTNPEERFSLLVEKVTYYLGYILGEGYQQEYPGLKPGDAKILVLCTVAPTDKMIRFTRLTNPENEMETITIEYQLFEASKTVQEPNQENLRTLQKPDSHPQSNRSIYQWVWVFVCIGLLGSAFYRIIVLKQSPLTPLLILFFIWRLRIFNRRRQWERIKAEMIAGGVSPECFKDGQGKQ